LIAIDDTHVDVENIEHQQSLVVPNTMSTESGTIFTATTSEDSVVTSITVGSGIADGKGSSTKSTRTDIPRSYSTNTSLVHSSSASCRPYGTNTSAPAMGDVTDITSFPTSIGSNVMSVHEDDLQHSVTFLAVSFIWIRSIRNSHRWMFQRMYL
jgi:hypothetical protein